MARSLPVRFPLALAFASLMSVPLAVADQIHVNFEDPPYVPGSVNGQDGWVHTDACGVPLDQEVVANTYGYSTFGGQSFRRSNAYLTGCFGDQTYSKPTLDEAGESSAGNDGMSGGARQPHFEAQWDFASTQPGSEQADLYVVASPDRGDGARMSWVEMADTPTGLEVNFYEYKDLAPFGSDGDPAPGCGAEDDFFLTNLASSLDRTVPHTIKITMDFTEGQANDVVKVWVDGTLRYTGTSWEDYFRFCEVNPTRTVDSILFRTGGGHGFQYPDNLGKGFLIDNLTITTSARPVRVDLRPGSTNNQVNTTAKQLVPIAILGDVGFDPITEVERESVVVRGASPLVTKFSEDDVNDDGIPDLTLFFRARDFDAPSEAECSDPQATILLEGSTMLGTGFSGTDRVNWLGC